ncbi:hypothetical protein [Niabella beijingensis]|uniref:hypothetical protein n=1 Tax=Niabella beijingensis TaxID=2872700 RepID=UPI001CBE2ECE|nr:hypothetical protein [Niabella beijingensis]MBZ4188466.1 hypothetical protein [Niabella beijingensis]
MIKALLIGLIAIFFTVACTRESSPDGRAQVRDEHIQKEIDRLKNQNSAILDSIAALRKTLDGTRRK